MAPVYFASLSIRCSRHGRQVGKTIDAAMNAAEDADLLFLDWWSDLFRGRWWQGGLSAALLGFGVRISRLGSRSGRARTARL